MIISHRHRFIFIKTQKTAGTSIEIALSEFCGPDDIITPIAPKDEELRRAAGFAGPRNFAAPLGAYSWRDVWPLVRHRRKKKLFYNHIDALSVRRLVGEATWQSYYKFCVVRNPWDLMVSYYYWIHRREPRPSLAEFIARQKVRTTSSLGYDLYTVDGQVAVDRVCRYENLSAELKEVTAKIGLSGELRLPQAKAGHRSDRREYRELLGPAERAKVEELFSREIDLFGYRF
jgi:hypothetical protein